MELANPETKLDLVRWDNLVERIGPQHNTMAHSYQDRAHYDTEHDLPGYIQQTFHPRAKVVQIRNCFDVHFNTNTSSIIASAYTKKASIPSFAGITNLVKHT